MFVVIFTNIINAYFGNTKLNTKFKTWFDDKNVLFIKKSITNKSHKYYLTSGTPNRI